MPNYFLRTTDYATYYTTQATTIQHGETARGVAPCQYWGLVSLCQLAIFVER